MINFTWSFSRWETWSSCPLAYKYQYIAKLKTPQHPAAARGTAVHENIEKFITGEDGVLRDFTGCVTEVKELKKQPMVSVEHPWGFNRKWQPVGFFDPNVWLRMILDASAPVNSKTVKVIDFKTGRIYDKHQQQGKLYAVGARCNYRGYKTYEVEFWYLDQDLIVPREYKKKELKEEKEYWTDQAARMEGDKKLQPTPSRVACRWCKFRSDKKLSNGKPGPCDLWKGAYR